MIGKKPQNAVQHTLHCIQVECYMQGIPSLLLPPESLHYINYINDVVNKSTKMNHTLVQNITGDIGLRQQSYQSIGYTMRLRLLQYIYQLAQRLINIIATIPRASINWCAIILLSESVIHHLWSYAILLSGFFSLLIAWGPDVTHMLSTVHHTWALIYSMLAPFAM